jgi:heme ABC exporter ATP-binding subunit CcmA
MDPNNEPMEHREAPAAAVRTSGLGKRFGRQWALAHCDLEVAPGEAVLLAGANGSGKTTLLRLIAGLYKPTQGELSIFGHSPRHERLTCRRQLTLIGHDHYLYSQLTALETLQVWARLSGHSGSSEPLLGLLEEVELEQHRDQRVGGFSAGMKKRLTLLRTRLENPRLILLDEPFSALDTAGQKLVETWVQGFIAEGKTVVVASHNLPRAARLCPRAIYLRHGQMIWQGEAATMVRQLGLTS